MIGLSHQFCSSLLKGIKNQFGYYFGCGFVSSQYAVAAFSTSIVSSIFRKINHSTLGYCNISPTPCHDNLPFYCYRKTNGVDEVRNKDVLSD